MAAGERHRSHLRRSAREDAWLRWHVLGALQDVRVTPVRQQARRAVVRELGVTDRLFDALATLSIPERAALIAAHAEGYGDPELAIMLNRSARGSARLLRRARATYLQAWLGPMDAPLDPDSHDALQDWLMGGAEGDPPLSGATHAAACEACSRSVEAMNALALIDLDHATAPVRAPSRPATLGAASRLGDERFVNAAVIVLAVGLALAAIGPLSPSTRSADGTDVFAEEEILGGIGFQPPAASDVLTGETPAPEPEPGDVPSGTPPPPDDPGPGDPASGSTNGDADGSASPGPTPGDPDAEPTPGNTPDPGGDPTPAPTPPPTAPPTALPTPGPSAPEPTAEPTPEPSVPEPTAEPTPEPTTSTPEPTSEPTPVPTPVPTPTPEPAAVSECVDGVDNDGDLLIDALDPGCLLDDDESVL
jgi:hypothetical protein